MDKEGFIVYKSFYEPIKELSLAHKGLLLSAIFEYQINKNVIELPIECRMAFKFFKNQFDLDEKKYTKICEKRAEAGRKSAERKLKEMLANADKCQQKQQMLTKATDKDNETDKDKEKEKDKDLNNTEYLNTNNNLNNKKKFSKNLNESDSFQFSVDFGKQIRIGQNFKINFEDEFFSPYRHASPNLVSSVESWLVKNKLGVTVDKNFICKQIANFAKKQGKYNELLGE